MLEDIASASRAENIPLLVLFVGSLGLEHLGRWDSSLGRHCKDWGREGGKIRDLETNTLGKSRFSDVVLVDLVSRRQQAKARQPN